MFFAFWGERIVRNPVFLRIFVELFVLIKLYA